MTKFKRLLPTILMLVFEAAIGVLLLIDGEKFTEIVFIIFGVFLLICGIITLFRGLMAGRNGGSISLSQIVLSVILLAVGAFFTAASGSVMSIMSTVTLAIGVIVTFNGMLKLVEYFSFRKTGGVAWFAIISAIITIILGIVIAFNPFGATEVMWVILGILILVSAALDVISLIVFSVALKKTPDELIEASFKDVG